MLQGFKRSKYLSQNNFQHSNAQDGIRMHLWLQKKMWPANEFLDWFMRAYPQPDEFTHISLKLYMSNQFDWVHENSIEALNKLYERVQSDRFQSQDSDNLTAWLKVMVDGANSR